MTVQFYPTELSRVLKSPGGPVGRHLNFIAREIAVEAQAVAAAKLQQRTRRYAQGFKVKVERGSAGEGFQFLILNSVIGTSPRRRGSYAAVIERGSRPHVIRPRDPNGVLAFTVSGKKIVTRKVNHPGTRAQHVLRDAEKLVRQRRGY